MDAEALMDLFAPLGIARVMRMFGGKGVYLDGLIVAVELSSGELLLKGDAVCAPAYEAAGGRRWIYEGETKAGAARRVAMPYWSAPDEIFDDEDALRRFGAMALEASRRAQAAPAAKAKPKGKGGSRPGATTGARKPTASRR